MKTEISYDRNMFGFTARIAVILFLAGVSFVLYVGVDYVRLSRAELLKQEGVSYQEKEAREQYLLNIMNALDETSAEQKRLSGYFLDEKSVAGFLGSLEGVARRVGLEVDTTSLGVFESTLKVETKVSGTYANIIHFISLVEVMPHKIIVPRVVMTHQNSSWTATLLIEVQSYLP